MFPLGGGDACTPRQAVTLLYGPSICTRTVQMDQRRSQVLRPFPTPGSGTLWVAGESLRDSPVSCLPRSTVCPTRSPSPGTNRSTCRGECSLSGPLVTPPNRCHLGPLTNGPGRIPPNCVCSGGADTVTGEAPKPPRLGPSPASLVRSFRRVPPLPLCWPRPFRSLPSFFPPSRASFSAPELLPCPACPSLSPSALPRTGTMHDSCRSWLRLGLRVAGTMRARGVALVCGGGGGYALSFALSLLAAPLAVIPPGHWCSVGAGFAFWFPPVGVARAYVLPALLVARHARWPCVRPYVPPPTPPCPSLPAPCRHRPPPSSIDDYPHLDARNCHFSFEYWPDEKNDSIKHNVHLAECAWLSTSVVQYLLEVLLPPGTTSVKPVIIDMAQLMRHFPTLSIICTQKCAPPLLLTSRHFTIGVPHVLVTYVQVDCKSLVIHNFKDATSECGAPF